MGRSLKNTLYNLGLTSAFEKAYKLDTPKTGDVTLVVPAMALMFGSGSVMTGMIFAKRKEEE